MLMLLRGEGAIRHWSNRGSRGRADVLATGGPPIPLPKSLGSFFGGARPKGSRNKLGEAISGGPIRRLGRCHSGGPRGVPGRLLKVVASILPKQLEIERDPFDGVTDDQLAAFIDYARNAAEDLADEKDETAH
jgi:hypothetical protein